MKLSQPLKAKASKVKPTRSRLTWDEIRDIEKKSREVFPIHQDVAKLIRHIRFIEHLLEKK